MNPRKWPTKADAFFWARHNLPDNIRYAALPYAGGYMLVIV